MISGYENKHGRWHNLTHQYLGESTCYALSLVSVLGGAIVSTRMTGPMPPILHEYRVESHQLGLMNFMWYLYFPDIGLEPSDFAKQESIVKDLTEKVQNLPEAKPFEAREKRAAPFWKIGLGASILFLILGQKLAYERRQKK